MALRDANAKFRRRFAGMEQMSAEPLDGLSGERLEELWLEAKRGDAAEKVL
jgi:XTP/dITP diphosphohydrolase/ATP diphosphatase